MSAILGIDAAWTPHNPSGVALIRQVGTGSWQAVAAESSYERFIDRFGTSSSKCPPGRALVSRLLDVAKRAAETEIVLVVIDIPLSTEAINGRRTADQKISTIFGGFGCAAHSPTPSRPGKVSEVLRDELETRGYPLATASERLLRPSLIESYPHPLLLSIMNVAYRYPYKVSKTKTYWPYLSREARLERIARNLERIRLRLGESIEGIEPLLPVAPGSFAALKPIEDMIDAFVCAWAGIQVLAGRAEPLGDERAAIWVPSNSIAISSHGTWSAYIRSGAVASEEFMEGVEDLPVEEMTQ
jgi:predicted RNase H-like nuclease